MELLRGSLDARMTLQELAPVEPPVPKDVGGDVKSTYRGILNILINFTHLWPLVSPFLKWPSNRRPLYDMEQNRVDVQQDLKTYGADPGKSRLDTLRNAILTGQHPIIRDLKSPEMSTALRTFKTRTQD